jgi:glucose/arabinose dehydrogenase
VQLFAAGLQTPTSFAFGGGSVFEGDGANEQTHAGGGVNVLKNGTATLVKGSPAFVGGLAWHQGALYVSGGMPTKTGIQASIQRWSGWNGTSFAKQTTIWKAPKKLDGLNGIGFGANGRLYVGVDLGLTDNNDHGSASKTPYLYDILSMTSAGKDLKVFATGMRQPWQMAFPKGSNSPYVSDLGQDSGLKVPLDALLRVKQGQDYGFPACGYSNTSKCKGFAKPFATFAPHTDIMGVVDTGKTLYLSSFLGSTGKAGEVFTLSTKKGAKLSPFVTGFVAPTVGLGESGGYLYIGEVGTGLVYRVKL